MINGRSLRLIIKKNKMLVLDDCIRSQLYKYEFLPHLKNIVNYKFNNFEKEKIENRM